jgi:hypothetical protein
MIVGVRRPGRAGAVIAVALSLVLTITACVGLRPSTTPPPSSTPVASPTSEPVVEVDPLETVAVVVVRPEHLELRDDSGATVQTLSYDLTAEEFVAALTSVFGGDPEIEERPGSCCESGAATIYHWDDFRVGDDHMGHFADHDNTLWIPEDVPDYRGMNLGVRATGSAVRGIPITTTVGFEVGEDIAALASGVGWPYDAAAEHSVIPVETGPELGPPEIEGMLNAYSVVVVGPEPDGTFFLTAPMNVGVPSV